MEREGRRHHRRAGAEDRDTAAADRQREVLDRLEAAVGAIQDSDSFRRYLDAQARFHAYVRPVLPKRASARGWEARR
jgi:hypothetical protein